MGTRLYSYKQAVAAEQSIKEGEYWLNQLSGEVTRTRFPYDYQREDINERLMKIKKIKFPNPLVAKLMDLSADKDTEVVNVKLHMILVTGLFILLNKYRNQFKDHSDIMMGSPLLKQEIQKEFINTVLVFKNRVNHNDTFKELLLQVRETIILANENQNYPMEVLLDQLNLPIIGNESPLFDVVVLLENLYDKHFIQEIAYNMGFSFRRVDQSVEGTVEYNSLLYRESTIKQIIRHYISLLDQVLQDVNVKLSRVQLLSEEEKKQVLFDFNNNQKDYPKDKTLHQLFTRQAKQTPNSIAIVGPGCTSAPGTGKPHLTYKQVEQKSDELARLLVTKGVTPDTIVGIKIEPSIERMVSILAILKAGGAYLPIDPNYPEERINYMLADSGANVLVATGSLFEDSKIGSEEERKPGSAEIEKVFLDVGNWFTCYTPGNSPLERGAPKGRGVSSPANLAYIIYTSGTTGKPKGVMVDHANVTAYLHAFYQEFTIGPKDTTIQLASYAFDVFVEEVFPLLLKGGKILIPDHYELLDIDSLFRLIINHDVTIIDCTPLLLNEFNKLISTHPLESSANSTRQHTIISGGDVLKKEYVDKLLKIGKVYNTYGPTEATICAAYYRYDGEDQQLKVSPSIPIGKPICNYSIYILDQNYKPVPIRVIGELCISGSGIARGYLNRPELTVEKFCLRRPGGTLFVKTAPPGPPRKNFLLEGTGGLTPLLYRTGDLARWLPDGNIEYVGRIDQQVKIRGYRIETEEIENRLLKIREIKEVVVTAKEDNDGDKYLCAYIVSNAKPVVENDSTNDAPEQALSPSELRECLLKELPDYMIPSYFVPLEKIPLTFNGKPDLKALPEPELKIEKRYTAPRDEVEEALVRIWSDVLGVERDIIGIDANFFELGGHSLKATTMISRIFKELNVKMSLGEVFKTPFIRELAEYIKATDKVKYRPIELVEAREYYPVSFAQRRLWILCQFEEDSTAYNIPVALEISGPISPAIFQHAVQALIDRHESLRTVFIIDTNGEPQQKILKKLEFNVQYINLGDLDDREKEEKAGKMYLDAAVHAFDLENGPLLLVKLVRLDDEKYLLISNIHHIVNDGWSQFIILEETTTLYRAFLENQGNPLLPIRYQYKDYTLWHNALVEYGRFDRSEEYWLKKCKDKPNGIQLPTDYPRKALQSFNGNRVIQYIDQEKTSRLEQLTLKEDATLFMGLLTLVSIFLYRYTGENDILIGAPIAGRKQVELHEMVGFLVNTIVYRNQVNPGENFIRVLEKVRKETMDCYEHQDYPFDLLVERLELHRDLSQSPLFNVMLAHNNADTRDDGLSVQHIEDIKDNHDIPEEGVRLVLHAQNEDFNMSKFDLIFFIDKIRDRLKVSLEYNSDLFKRSTAQRMVTDFLNLVQCVLNNPTQPISKLNFMDKSEYETVVHHFNATSHRFPKLTIQELLEQQVEKTPHHTAVVCHHEHISYEVLNHKANQLAHLLREKYQVKPNDIIGVFVDRSIAMIITILGIIKSGAGYVSIDPNYPKERIRHILADSETKLIILDEENPECLEDYHGQRINIHHDWNKILLKAAVNPGIENQLADIVYVIYTSGSTGMPNGAMLSHAILSNLVQWQQEKTGIDSSRRCLQFTSINFCVSFQEIIITLSSGGQVHLIGDIERQDIDYLMNFLSRHKIEILYLPFSYLNFLFNESGRWGESFKHSLKHIITAGEQLKITAGLKHFLERNPGLKLHNHYGSSEMHVVTSYTLDASTADQTPLPPAGQPISNTRIFILDNDDNVVPIGVWGELCVGGCAEIAGYINNRALTHQKLTLHPELCQDNIRLYRSGDIGRWKENGNIELKGRKDLQVKIHGFRVEPGEIESKITMIEQVKDCVVVVKEWNNEKYLAAYVVLDNITPQEITRTIRGYLPQHMIPLIIELDALPLMPNGKVDRERLPEPDIKPDENYMAPRNEIEEKLVEIWADILKIEPGKISISASFFDLGGHSLKATVLASRIHKELNVEIPLAEIFKGPTIEEIAYLITALEWSSNPNRDLIDNQELEEIIL